MWYRIIGFKARTQRESDSQPKLGVIAGCDQDDKVLRLADRRARVTLQFHWYGTSFLADTMDDRARLTEGDLSPHTEPTCKLCRMCLACLWHVYPQGNESSKPHPRYCLLLSTGSNVNDEETLVAKATDRPGLKRYSHYIDP